MADKKINISLNISAQTQELKTKIQDIQKTLNNVRMPDFDKTSMTKDLASLQTRLEKLTQISNKPAGVLKASDMRQAEKEIGNVQSALRGMTQQLERVEGLSKKEKLKLFPEDTQNKIKNITKAIKEYNDAVDNQTKREKASLTAKNRLFEAQDKVAKLEEKQKTSFQGKQRVSNNDYQQYKKQYEQYSKDFKEIDEFRKKEGFQWNKKYDKTQQIDFKGQIISAEHLHKKWKQLQDDSKKYNELVKGSYTTSQQNELTKEIDAQKEAVANLKKAYNEAEANKPSGLFENLKKVAQDAKVSLDGIDDSAEGAKTLINRLENFNSSKVNELDTDLGNLKGTISSLTPEADELAEQINKTSEEVNIATQRAQELSNLKSQVLSFFTITGAVQLFRQAVQSAFETVKELDEAMTEIAVVSDFSVGDMWKQLPKFTEQANQLGKSIRDVYGATTLYVQQGLDLDNSLKLANETLKMAAVAGMDAADATDAMTSALRGFNMELSETSAQKVNDVYSELAAISAADTQEISTAMSKVASLAHNVNMEFETTASFLTQGIEATREAPETIGTALKTIIARFAEVKSLYTKGQLSGTDEEGETIDVNKVQTALRSAGVSMNAFLKGEEGLDQVLLRLSSRWNDLDVLTQRYIATMASGSRQQSRFIAMMDNYAKTTEFVNSAYNSAGSGQRQFEKTLESLEAKLTKLKNAWDEFAMGLTNNVIIKGAVDTLTVLLTAVNRLIDGLSGGHGLIKSVMTLGVVWGGLKLGGNLVDKALASNWVQNKIKLSKGDPETVANVRGTNAERTSYFQKGINMAKEFQKGFQSFKANPLEFSKKELLGFGEKEVIQEKPSLQIENDVIENSTEIFEKQRQELASLEIQFRNNDITLEEYQEGVAELSAVEEVNAIRTQEATEVLKKQIFDAKKLGTTMTTVGGAFMVLAGIFSRFGEEGEKAASTLATIGGVLVTIGQLLPTLKAGIISLSATLHMAVPELAIIMGALVAIGALITAFVVAWNNNSPEAKLEKASKATEKAKEMAEGASQAYDELLSKKSEFDKLATSLETLTQGTLEWRKALAETNNEVINLQKEFPELEVSVDKVIGQLKIDNWGEVLKAQAERIEATNKQLAMARVNENNAQLAVTKKNISNNNDLTAEQKVSQRKVEQLKTETNNMALIDSIISKYKTDKNEDYLGNFGELLTKKVTYDTYKHNGEKEKTISGEKTENVFEKAIKNKANKVINEKSTNEQKEYAEQIFGKDAVDNMKDSEEIKNAILNYEKANQIEKLTEKILSYSEEDQKAFQVLQGSFSGKVSDWDSSDYLFLPDEQLKKFQEDLNLESTDAVSALLNEGRIQIQDTINKATDDFTNLGFDSNFIDQFSLDNLSSISSQISEMSNESAKEYLKAFNEAINNTSLQEEEKKRLENYLSSIDLSDAVQVLDAKEFMKNLGMDETQIEKFWATANTAVKPYITSLEQVQSLNERISKLGEVRSLVENGEKTFSSSDKESLVGAGFADSDFLQTGIDEWTYIGKDSNDLLRQINEKIAQIGETIVGGLQDSVVAGEKYQPIIESNKELKDDLELLKENGLEGVSLSDDRIREMAEQLKIDTTDLSIEGIANKLIDAINMADNLASNKEAVQSEKLNSASRQYDLTENFGTFTGSLTEDEQITIMTAQLNKYNGAMEYYEKLKAEAGDTSNDFNLELADEAVRLFKLQKQYDKTADSIDTYKDALVQGESAGTDYYNALATAKTDLSTLFNVDKGLITDDFVQQYTQDIYNLAEGGETATIAYNNLNEALNQFRWTNLQKEIEELGGNYEKVANNINELDPTLEVKTLADNSGLISALNDMVSKTDIAEGEVMSKLLPIIQMIETISGTNIKIDWEYDESDYLLPNMVTSQEAMKLGYVQGRPGGAYFKVKGIKALDYSSKSTRNLSGLFSSRGGSSGSSSSSGSEKKETTWENPYDKLYNLTEEINEALRQREKLEREYDRILERRGSTFQELRKNYNAQLQSLQKEITLQEQLRTGRLAQLNALSSETYKGQDSDGNELIKSFADWGATRYGSYDPNTGLLKIDWDAIDAVKDENTGGAIEAYISRLEELEGQLEDIDTQIEDFQDKVTELQKEGMQDYLDFEQKVYDAIVNQQQQLIDDYQDLSDKINDSNSKILDSIQRSIDLQRQIRDNTQTEEDINEKEARLAYLRQDTSNGNLLEIKQLEEELADDRQNYEDNLIDQQLERLAQQNDDAQTARERQIDLMQKQLDYASKNGDFWNQTYDLLTNAFTESGEINLASQVWGLLKKDEGWKGMSKFGQLNWQEEISKAILAASHGYANWNMYKAKEVDKNLVTSNGLSLHYNGSNWVDSSGNIYSGVDYDSKIGGFTYSGMTKAPTPSGGSGSSSGSGSGGSGSISIGSRVKADPNAVIYADSYGGGGGSQYYSNDPIYTVLDENNGYYLTRYHGVSGGYTGWFRKKDLTAYKTGGIADFTGPAWLDGTKSNPELILNARDTENFIALKDILSSIMDRKGLQNRAQSVGDMYFNIDINVDELSNDYDVEDLSKKIKQELTDSAMYRNVNLVNFIR